MKGGQGGGWPTQYRRPQDSGTGLGDDLLDHIGTVSPAHGASTDLGTVYKSWYLLDSHTMLPLPLLPQTHRPQGELVRLMEESRA